MCVTEQKQEIQRKAGEELQYVHVTPPNQEFDLVVCGMHPRSFTYQVTLQQDNLYYDKLSNSSMIPPLPNEGGAGDGDKPP